MFLFLSVTPGICVTSNVAPNYAGLIRAHLFLATRLIFEKILVRPFLVRQAFLVRRSTFFSLARSSRHNINSESRPSFSTVASIVSMLSSSLLSLAALFVASVSAVYQGFNYGSTNTDGSAVLEADFQSRFTTAQNLVGTSGFTSARLYTMVQAGTTNTPIQAIQAAINTNTTLLLGLWASAGQASFNNELAALKSAITQYGAPFTKLIAGISVGSEDLYRSSPIGVINLSGIGANPSDIVSYIGQVRSAIAGTAASSAPVGHVDTWTAWVNGSNVNVINSCDFLGVDAYPYFQNTEANSIDAGYSVFFQAYNNTVGVSTGKPVWITETGWPVSGKTENLAVASVQNAQTYWDNVGCAIFGKINTWWFTLQDGYPTVPSPSFGIVGTTLSTTPLYNLTCPAVVAHVDNAVQNATSSIVSGSATASSASAASGSAASSAMASGSAKASNAVSAAASLAGLNSSATLSPSSTFASGTSGASKVMVASSALALVIATLFLFIA